MGIYNLGCLSNAHHLALMQESSFLGTTGGCLGNHVRSSRLLTLSKVGYWSPNQPQASKLLWCRCAEDSRLGFAPLRGLCLQAGATAAGPCLLTGVVHAQNLAGSSAVHRLGFLPADAYRVQPKPESPDMHNLRATDGLCMCRYSRAAPQSSGLGQTTDSSQLSQGASLTR